MNEAELFKGRKGRKKQEALEQQIKRMSDEFDNRYLHTREMKYISENIQWRITSRIVFLMGQRVVHFRWKGLRDYGFIRLCAQWFESKKITEPSPEDIVELMGDVLPKEQYDKLSEDLKTLEFI